MGSSLGPLLANIIVTKMEKTIIKKFIDDKILLFYGYYFDCTLVVIKREHLKLGLDALNYFKKNLNFTVDTFGNVAAHFLDIEILTDDMNVYCKDANKDNLLIITVISHIAAKHLRFFPYYTGLSIFAIKKLQT